MANESQVLAVTAINDKKIDVTVVGTGGTLTGSNILEVRFLKADFDGISKQALKLLLQEIEKKLTEADWPVT